MMRFLYVTALTTLLISCQSTGPSTSETSETSEPSAPDIGEELTRVIDFHHSLADHDSARLLADADQIKSLLAQDSNDSAIKRLQLLMLESEIQVRELQQTLETQSQQIQALNTQIEALTTIEQQMNRRGRQQETANE